MMKLYSFFRSGTSHRLRIALNLKGIGYTVQPVNLRSGAHKQEEYLEISAQGFVPALQQGEGDALIQSPAIIEYLDETVSGPALFPVDVTQRAKARAMAAVIGCDIHPINNLRILNELKNTFNADQGQIDAWARKWIEEGFHALEQMLPNHVQEEGYAFGESPGVVECYLSPQVFSAARFGTDLDPFPKIQALSQRCEALPAFYEAHPSRQPDTI